jgi:hypothetical protein
MLRRKDRKLFCRRFGTIYQSDLQELSGQNILGIWTLEERIAWSQNFNTVLKSTPRDHSQSRFNPIYIHTTYSFKILIIAVFLPKLGIWHLVKGDKLQMSMSVVTLTSSNRGLPEICTKIQFLSRSKKHVETPVCYCVGKKSLFRLQSTQNTEIELCVKRREVWCFIKCPPRF